MKRVNDIFAERRWRTVLLGSVIVGWAGVVIGAVTESGLLVAVGAVVLAVINLLLAKALLETSSAVRPVAALRESMARDERTLHQTAADLDGLRSRVEELAADVASQQGALERSRADVGTHQAALERLRADAASIFERISELGRQQNEAKAGSAALAGAIDDIRAQVAGLAGAHDTTRAALAATRALSDKLAVRARGALVEDRRLQAVATTDVESPLLSIAIPSFNRPGALAELLASIVREVSTCPPGLVEVCITDDASPDPEVVEIALAFAEQHRFASLRLHPSNVGIERNVIAAGEPCRGEYLLLVGNDDLLTPGALTTILDDLRNTAAPLLLYAKRRINLDGSPRTDIAGSIPIELPAGEAHVFESCIDAARQQGLLSTFGFIGPIVRRRHPFLAIDPSPYLDLTMYSQVCVTIEAFAREAVFYRNAATIIHRTPTMPQKHAESLGRREEEFMRGGSARQARYFGTSLAAALQRLIDRGALEHETVATLPERLMTNLSLVDWIAYNRSIDPAMDERLGADVVADADRFSTSLAATEPPGALR